MVSDNKPVPPGGLGLPWMLARCGISYRTPCRCGLWCGNKIDAPQ